MRIILAFLADKSLMTRFSEALGFVNYGVLMHMDLEIVSDHMEIEVGALRSPPHIFCLPTLHPHPRKPFSIYKVVHEEIFIDGSILMKISVKTLVNLTNS